MLKIYLLFFMLLLCFHTKSQSNYLQSFGSTATDEALKNTTDIWGNVYTTGFFSNTCKFDTVTLTSKGAADIFVCKQNASGTLLWSISAGGNGSDRAYGLSSDKWGNLFITGVFADSASFGNFTLLSKNNTQDIFIAKIDSGGNFLWAKLFGGNDIDISLSCMADTNGNVIFTGQFKDSIYFGNNGYLSAFNPITNSVSFDMFIAKCDSAGNIVWSKTGSSKYDDRGLALTIDEKNSIYLGFQFSDTLDFGTVYNNIGFNASALCKMDENGNITWFKKFIASSVSLYNLAYAQNSIYMAGDYSGKMILPQNPISYLQTPFINQLFLIRMRPDGSVANAFATGSNNQLHCYSLASDAQGTACIGGVFECEMTALNQEFGDALFKSVGEYDVFYAAYDTLANRLYARHIGGHGKDNCASVTMQNKYHPTLCGSFEHIINVPDGNNFQPHGSNSNVSSQGPGIKPNHCGEAWYGKFISCLTNGNKDIFFAQPFDSTRAIYDYYFRTDTNCVHPVVSPFINGKDTIIGCDSVPVSVWLPTGQNAVIGPQYNFLWSNGKTEQSICNQYRVLVCNNKYQ
ncbi:MAG: hypothetical protein IPO27_01805 [Bacteroidetes bacterium]|nr:hypothetical protein [Bacteroidota bacterium]